MNREVALDLDTCAQEVLRVEIEYLDACVLPLENLEEQLG